MDDEIFLTQPNNKNQDAKVQETINVLADEVLQVLKELHQEHKQLLTSKMMADKMFCRASIKQILDSYGREGIQSENRVDSLKETVENILHSFSELLPLSMMDQLSAIKDQHFNKVIPLDSAASIESAVRLVKKYVDFISCRINELEEIMKYTTNCLSEMEKSLMSELFSTRVKLSDEMTFEMTVASDMNDIKQSFDKSGDIPTIKNVVFSKIANITRLMEEKKAQELLRLHETEKSLDELSKKMNHIVNEVQAVSKKSLEMEIESHQDHLTQLFNRKAYDNKIVEILADLDRYSTSASLLIFDIDYFKEINSSFGHHTGDLTLNKFAGLLKENFRKNDFISRYGGDEFVCILPHAHLEMTRQAAEKFRSLIDRTKFTFKGKEVPVTISAGVSTFKKGDDATTLFERADAALYLAKHSGRNMVKTESDLGKGSKEPLDID